jgi:hypothetical protein
VTKSVDEPVAAEAAGPALRLTATWDCWWGSSQLLAQVARKALRELEAIGSRSACQCTLRLKVAQDVETFDSPEAFVIGASPEGLSKFREIEVEASGNGINVTVRFERERRRRIGTERDQAVTLAVTTMDPALAKEATTVAQEIATSLKRGYFRFWADVRSSTEIREQAGKPLRGHAALVLVTIALVGALLGAGLVRLLDDLPGIEVPSAVAVALLAGAGMGYPWLVERLVPNVEIAALGHTRLISIARKSAIALGTFVGTHLLQLLIK